MQSISPPHLNNCPRCPVIGTQDCPDEENYHLLTLRFSLRIAKELSKGRPLVLVDPDVLGKWLEHAHILPSHVDHIPSNSGHGIMATLPAGCGMPLIDGNHRAARALREQSPFFAAVLDRAQTLELLRRSMGTATANHYWVRLSFQIHTLTTKENQNHE